MEENLPDSLQMPDSFVLKILQPPIGVGIVILEIRKPRLRKAKQLIEAGTVTVWQSRDRNLGSRDSVASVSTRAEGSL